jgi:hypothetical protein
MVQARAFASLVVGLAICAAGGWFIARGQASYAILMGPYSDNYGPALSAIEDCKAKLRAGDTDIKEQLQTAESHLSTGN